MYASLSEENSTLRHGVEYILVELPEKTKNEQEKKKIYFVVLVWDCFIPSFNLSGLILISKSWEF